jgi:hypothetical protein
MTAEQKQDWCVHQQEMRWKEQDARVTRHRTSDKGKAVPVQAWIGP